MVSSFREQAKFAKYCSLACFFEGCLYRALECLPSLIKLTRRAAKLKEREEKARSFVRSRCSLLESTFDLQVNFVTQLSQICRIDPSLSCNLHVQSVSIYKKERERGPSLALSISLFFCQHVHNCVTIQAFHNIFIFWPSERACVSLSEIC